MHFSTVALASSLLISQSARAIQLDANDAASVQSAAKTVAGNIMDLYRTKHDPDDGDGVFPSPYYWWESGAVWDAMINYYYLTGDSQYNGQVTQNLLAQVGSNENYMPPNQTKSEGNDDQAFWALAAMSAAEYGLPNSTSHNAWVELAQTVFNTQADRWDADTCFGGLRWQVFTFNNGYNYKNSLSNGMFFQLAARLGQYTGNNRYAGWAESVFSWMQSTELISPDWAVWDGADVTEDCSSPNHMQWSANAGALLYGSAVMYNLTNGNSTWKDRVQNLLKGTSVFTITNSSTIYEVACESVGTCDADQIAFKGLFARDLAQTAKWAPFTENTITPILKASANGAAAACSGGSSNDCGLDWTKGKYDGKTGLSQELAALHVFQANLVKGSGDIDSSTNPTAAKPAASGPTGSSSSNSTSNPSSPGSGTGSGTSSGAPPSGSSPAPGAGSVLSIKMSTLVGLLLGVIGWHVVS
ncbi:MAG: hydrolase 76 protein [Bogoriella megaspora]|nr:MAG: hydrolase 76 protein [Bogoriella megaspora]